jgi:imidazole glycerol-phosphate synthase subunit HisH
MEIVIIDYKMGNSGSIENMLKHLGYSCKISNDPEVIQKADKYILPGVGSFDVGINNLKEFGLWDILNEQVLIKCKPILGICMGMQLLTNGSDEGIQKGLGWIPGYTFGFKNINNLEIKIPHIGWNSLITNNRDSFLDDIKDDEDEFYFVHSYYVLTENREYSFAQTEYYINFDSVIIKDNIIGVQFHPEKSLKFGKKLFKNFAKI